MTRDEYINFRNNRELPLTLVYDYYKIKTVEKILSFEDFSKAFLVFFDIYKPDFKDFYNYYDIKFEVLSIVDIIKPENPVIFI